MRTKRGLRPVVERLESMTLLSGLAGAAHHASAAPVTFSQPLSLTGTVNGSFQTKGNGSSVTASGAPSPIGKAKVSGTVTMTGTTDAVGNLTVTTKQGKLLISLNGTLSGQQASGTYTINGGTKAFSGESGTGPIVATFSSPSASGKGRFSSTFG